MKSTTKIVLGLILLSLLFTLSFPSKTLSFRTDDITAEFSLKQQPSIVLSNSLNSGPGTMLQAFY